MAHASPENHDRNDKMVFWGCFMALVTTSFAFFSRLYLCNTRFGGDFGLDKGAVGTLAGAGIWPFAISIILFSLIIDRIGYKVAMLFSFACYAIYLTLCFLAFQAIQGVAPDQLPAARAKGYSLLYWGSVILALGNGTVEAFINPVVATMFSKDKTKWLNILHAGWPGGLTFGGIITIMLAETAEKGDWRVVVGIIAVPAIIYLLMLVFARFPVNEREQAGVSYRSMLGELGGFGALIAFGLISMQLAEVIVPEVSPASADIKAAQDDIKALGAGAPGAQEAQTKLTAATDKLTQHKWIFTGVLTAIGVAVFVLYTRSLGRGIMAFLIIIMMPLAVTEIGTDGWITGLMGDPMKAAGYNPGWVLVYTSVIMMVLRFFAGVIVHKLSPIGLLILSASLAVAGLFALSKCGSAGLGAIFAAATLYAFGKTFFWPTMLGITSEQCPKGGALTLNAISGIGMIAVGVLGFPFIGAIQEQTATAELKEKNAAAAALVIEDKAIFGQSYQAINPDKVEKVTDTAAKDSIAAASKEGQFQALAKMALFPTFMLICYIILFLYFKSKGGYKAQDITHGGH
ncbi:MAG TPA: MFS transporter [Gemmataceae bacterium]|jgi:MFS family permease|nr:MFS transporter [Gemmataceae bacterium]